jgi:hypothetical protein
MIELLGAGNSSATWRIRQLYAALMESSRARKGNKNDESSKARCDALRSAQRLPKATLIRAFGAQELVRTRRPRSARVNIPIA